MTSKLSRLAGIKKAQVSASLASGGRMADKQREEDIAARLDEMTPKNQLEILLDDMRRLLFTLVRDADWTAEDVETLSAIDNPASARAMIETLHGVLFRAGLSPISHDEWAGYKVMMAREEEAKRQADLRMASANAARRHMLDMTEGLKIHDGELAWAAEMIEIIPVEKRGEVKREWMAAYEDQNFAMESDRYRNANLILLHAAQKANPDKFKEAAERKRNKH